MKPTFADHLLSGDHPTVLKPGNELLNWMLSHKIDNEVEFLPESKEIMSRQTGRDKNIAHNSVKSTICDDWEKEFD